MNKGNQEIKTNKNDLWTKRMENEQKKLKISSHFRKKIDWKFFIKKFLLAQKLHLKISGGTLGIKSRIQSHLGVENGEKHPLGQNCPIADATII